MENLLFALLLVLFVGVLIAGYFIVRNLRKATVPAEAPTFSAKWSEIEKLIKSDSETSWKLAVIEADKLMDSALKSSKMRGQTMGERLRFAVSRYPKIQKVWEAHILRNDLVHEKDRQITKQEAERAMVLFKEGLQLLKVL